MNKTSKIIGLGLMGVLLVGSITFASDINKLKRGDWVESEQAYLKSEKYNNCHFKGEIFTQI